MWSPVRKPTVDEFHAVEMFLCGLLVFDQGANNIFTTAAEISTPSQNNLRLRRSVDSLQTINSQVFHHLTPHPPR